MKILLIEPAKAPVSMAGEDVFIFEPLALEYVAAGVIEDHDVRIIDLRIDKNLQELLENFSPDIVGITAYTVHVNTVRNLFDRIKKWNSKILTVVGGHHATVAPEDFSQTSIDLIVLGEGVLTFKQIVDRHEKGNDFEGIPGITYTKNNEFVRTDYSKMFDLDALPFPERKLTSKYRRHYYSEWMKPLASIRTSKGCPYRCNFCALWKLTDGKYFKRKPEMIVEELKNIDEEFVFFADDESLVDVERMKTLAALIKSEGINKRYFLYGRSDTITNNPELLKMWKDVGLERVFVGLEFFNDDDLKYIRKSSTTDDNEKAIKILHDLDIDVYASFILRPEFNKDDFASFARYCQRLKLNFASFAVLTPLPGTDLYEEVKTSMITHNYDFFDFIHTLLPTKLSLNDFYEQYVKLFKKSIPPSKGISFLLKYKWKEILPTLIKSYRWQKRLRTAYLDY